MTKKEEEIKKFDLHKPSRIESSIVETIYAMASDCWNGSEENIKPPQFSITVCAALGQVIAEHENDMPMEVLEALFSDLNLTLRENYRLRRHQIENADKNHKGLH